MSVFSFLAFLLEEKELFALFRGKICKFCEIDNQFHIDTLNGRSYNSLPYILFLRGIHGAADLQKS